jgi:hypothetical protein
VAPSPALRKRPRSMLQSTWLKRPRFRHSESRIAAFFSTPDPNRFTDFTNVLGRFCEKHHHEATQKPLETMIAIALLAS